MQTSDDKPRMDKWLWAARFFKTRSLAKDAIEGGKVHCEGQRNLYFRTYAQSLTI